MSGSLNDDERHVVKGCRDLVRQWHQPTAGEQTLLNLLERLAEFCDRLDGPAPSIAQVDGFVSSTISLASAARDREGVSPESPYICVAPEWLRDQLTEANRERLAAHFIELG